MIDTTMRNRSEKKLLKALEKQKKPGEEHEIQQALVDLANFYRAQENWSRLIEISEERHARHVVEENPQHVLIYLAGTLSKAKMNDEALAYMDRVKEDYAKFDKPVDSIYHSTLISICLAHEDYSGAVDACREVLDITKDHTEYADFWDTQAQLADILQYKLNDAVASIHEREILWRHFRAILDDKRELFYNAAVIHVSNGARYAYALTQVDPQKAPAIYAALIEDLKRSRWFGPEAVEIPHLRKAWDDCEKKL